MLEHVPIKTDMYNSDMFLVFLMGQQLTKLSVGKNSVFLFTVFRNTLVLGI